MNTVATQDSARDAAALRTFNWIATIATLLLFAIAAVWAMVDPRSFDQQLAKDNADGSTGLIEHLTVIVLIPAILAAFFALARYRRALPHILIGGWIAMWAAACIYFAGEEASWGQWYFGWETPETLTRLNDQGETNLHNMSSWLDQKPRALVELFIVVAGLVLPALRYFSRGRPVILRRGTGSQFEEWCCAPAGLMAAAAIFAFSKVAGAIPGELLDPLGRSEWREFVIAWFLAWYLASYVVRLRSRRGKT